jgi:tetratricopeptide (TPR) repeat protein
VAARLLRIAALAGVLAAACAPRRAPPPQPLALEVGFAGCVAVREGPVCETSGGELTLWLKAPPGAALRIAVDGKELPVEGPTRDGGVQLRVPVPSGAHELAVTAARGGEAGSFRLPLAAPDITAAFRDADALRRAGKLDEAERGLAALLPEASPGLRAQAVGRLARIRLAQSRSDEAIKLLHQAIDLDRPAGRLSDEFRDRLALSFTLSHQLRRFTEARAALAPLDALAADRAYPEGHAARSYYAGVLAYETGDLRAGLRLIREAKAGATRLGLEELGTNALEIEAEVLHLLGRRDEAAARLEQVRAALATTADACRRADLSSHLGWFRLDVDETDDAPSAPPEDPIPPLQEALSLYRSGCPRPPFLANVLTDLAMAEARRGDLGAARGHLDEARRADPDSATRNAEELAIEGRLALTAGDARRALDLYGRLGGLAERALLRDAAWQAALGRAEALEALGRFDDAREAYVEAERLLDEQSLLIPLGEGKATFLGRHDRGARRLVDFLMRRQSPAEAAAAARLSRVRVIAAARVADGLGALDAGERARWEEALATYRSGREALDAEAAADWKLAADKLAAAVTGRKAREAALRGALEQALATLGPGAAPAAPGARLPAPEPDEALLVYHPIPGGWAAFAITAAGTSARRLPPIDLAARPAELGRQLLEPVRDALAGVRRLRVLAHGALAAVDFHALPHEGAPLVGRFAVTYGVDLPGRAGDGAGGGGALIVADPRGDLPAAREEARAAAAILEERGGPRARRLSGLEATHPAVRDAIQDPAVGLLHYAGHGIFDGPDGWESGLPLAEGGRLTVADVLALRRAPALVLLSGCETARTGAGQAGGLGVAQAFVLSGARAVVAATRRVDDALAERLMRAVHRSLGAGEHDLGAALGQAQLAIAREAPDQDWSSFRVLVP